MRRAAKYRCLAAFTLVELLLAMGITALVGLAAAAMLYSSAYGTSADYDLRGLLVKCKSVESRLADAIGTAKQVVQATSSYAIFWVDDTNDDDAMQEGEMILIERDTASNELRLYADPTDTDDYTSLVAFRGLAKLTYPFKLWATDVTALQFNGTTNPASTVLLSYTFTVTDSNISETVSGAVAQRVVQ